MKKSTVVSDSSRINNDGFKARNEPKWIETFTEMRIASMEKIIEIFKRITDQISKIQEEFQKAFNEQYDKEFELYKKISEYEIEDLLIDLKEQLNQKEQKIKNFESQIFEFKLSPYLKVIDPLMMIPCAEDIEKKRLSIEKDLETQYQKITQICLYEKYTCTFCQMKINRLQQFGNHLKKQHSMIFKYICPICQFKAYDEQILAQHLLINHDDNQNLRYVLSYTCIFTNIKFSGQMKLRKHLRKNINYHSYQHIQ